MKRIFLIVLDSFGVGAEPDAADFGDVGANTLRSCSTSKRFAMPNLIAAGFGNLDGVDFLPKSEHHRRHRAASGALPRQGHHHRALGDLRHRLAAAPAHLPARLPGGGLKALPRADRARRAV